MDSDIVFIIGALAGFFALVVAFAWDDVHCPCCERRRRGGKK